MTGESGRAHPPSSRGRVAAVATVLIMLVPTGVFSGPTIQATARRLEGAESRRAARLLARKHPLLHGVLVPLTHRLGRAKTGKTVHFQLTPLDHGQVQ